MNFAKKQNLIALFVIALIFSALVFSMINTTTSLFVLRRQTNLMIAVQGPTNYMYVDGSSTSTAQDGKTPDSPLRSIAAAYEKLTHFKNNYALPATTDGTYYIVLSGDTEQDAVDYSVSPTVYNIPVTITSTLNNVSGLSAGWPDSTDYGATLTLNGNQNLGAKTVFRSITLGASSQIDLYASGNPLTIDSGVTLEQTGALGFLGVGSGKINLYGGSSSVTTDSTSLTVNSGEFSNVYGGGNGANTSVANDVSIDINGGEIANVVGHGGDTCPSVGGDVIIDISNATVTDTVYGNGTAAANILNGSTSVRISGTSEVENVFGNGGGNIMNTANAAFAVSINIESGVTIGGTIYGTGDRTATVNGNTSISLTGAQAVDIYGGGNADITEGSSTVRLSGSTVTGNVFGGNNSKGEIRGDTHLIVENSSSVKNVYGGSKGATNNAATAKVTGNTDVFIGNSTITSNAFGGGYYAQVDGISVIIVNNTTVKNILAGGGYGRASNSTSGQILGDSFLFINAGNTLKNVYGAGYYGASATAYTTFSAPVTVSGTIYAGSTNSRQKADNAYIKLTVNTGLAMSKFRKGQVTAKNAYFDNVTSPSSLPSSGFVYGTF